MAGLRYDVTHMMTAVLLVREGLGITLLPRLALPALLLQGMPHRPIADAIAERTIGVLRRRDVICLRPAGCFWKNYSVLL